MLDQDKFREAMQRVAAPVTAITTLDGDSPAGLMATAVCSLSADPPSLIVCVNRTATAHDAILRAGIVGVSLFPDQAVDYAGHFAKVKGADRFRNGEWIKCVTGAPIYRSAPVAFDCRIATQHEGYSHTIIIAEIVHIHFGEDPDPSCLIWHKCGFVKMERHIVP